MSIEFVYYCEAQELEGTKFWEAGEQEISLDCYCDYDWDSEFGGRAYLCSALINGSNMDVIGGIGPELRAEIEERAVEVVIERAETKQAIRDDTLWARRKEV
jgi:hypothetical protein